MSAGVNRVAQGVSRHSLEEVITGKKRPLYELGWMDTEMEVGGEGKDRERKGLPHMHLSH